MCRSLTTIKRLFSTEIILSSRRSISPVNLSYASYEDTASRTGVIPAPLVVLHGLFGSKGNWNSMCKALHSRTNPTRKVIAVDARNHGDSPHTPEHSYEAMAQDIRQLLDTQRVQKVNLLGHSMGGRVAMLFSMKWPEFVERIIVADISPVSSSVGMGKMREYFDIMQTLVLEKNLPLSTARAFADAHLARLITDKGVRAFLLTNLVQKPDGSFGWRVNVPALKANYQRIADFTELMEDMKFNGPTLFIAGGMSDYIQQSDHSTIKKIFPKAQFETIDGAGHWLHSEKPNEFLKLVLKFLNAS